MAVLIPKHSMLRPHGTVIVTDGDGPEMQRDTVMCAHCGKHGIYRPGCGRNLGYCAKCHGPVCGTSGCSDECLPLEKRLDLYEAGEIPSL